MKIPVIKGTKFILRPFKEGDEKSLVKNLNNKNIIKNLANVPFPYRLKHAKSWIEINLKEHQNKKSTIAVFVIDVGGDVVGSVAFHKIVPGHKAEVGYWLEEDYWGQGIMTEALRLITEFGFGKLKLRRLQLDAYSFNKASMRVAEKAGYGFEGIMKKGVKKDGKFIDVHIYSKIK